MTTLPEPDLSRFVTESAKTLLAHSALSGGVYVGLPVRCHECQATVRMLGEVKIHGSYVCPLCGCRLPYAFWKVACEKQADPAGGTRSVNRTPELQELILELARQACQDCGEGGVPPCRCGRIAAAAAQAKLQAERGL